MITKLRKAPLVFIIGLLLLTGCSALPSGAVGVKVGDQMVHSREVDEVIELFARYPQLNVANGAIVSVFAQSAILDQVAQEKDVQVSDAEIDAAMGSDELLAAINDDPVGANFERRMAKASLIFKQVGAISADDYIVEVNPRYGDWEPSTLQIVGSASLSVESRS